MMEISEEVELQMINFIRRLEQGTSLHSARNLLHHYRDRRPVAFTELIKVHLSFLLDLPPGDFLSSCPFSSSSSPPLLSAGDDERSSHLKLSQSVRKQFFRNLLSKLLGKSNDSEKLTTDGADVIGKLVRHLLDHKESLVEGLFRKTGNLAKQKLLRRQLSDPSCSDSLDLLSYSPHDIACVLKALLHEHNILSHDLAKTFLALCQLDKDQLNTQECSTIRSPLLRRLSRAKQLKGCRLLCLLLDSPHRCLLLDLLRLLHATAHCPVTRMTPDTLGTLFGPLLFAPRCSNTTAISLRDKYRQFSAATRDLIYLSGDDLDLIPLSVVIDVEQNSRSLCRSSTTQVLLPTVCHSPITEEASTNTPLDARELGEPLDTCVRFASSPCGRSEFVTSGVEVTQLLDYFKSGLPNRGLSKRRYNRRLTRAVCSSIATVERNGVCSLSSRSSVSVSQNTQSASVHTNQENVVLVSSSSSSCRSAMTTQGKNTTTTRPTTCMKRFFSNSMLFTSSKQVRRKKDLVRTAVPLSCHPTVASPSLICGNPLVQYSNKSSTEHCMKRWQSASFSPSGRCFQSIPNEQMPSLSPINFTLLET